MAENYKQLYRSTTDSMLAGVCGGLGEYAALDPTVVRLLFVLAFFLTGPGILLAYLIMMLIIPPAPVSQ
ncbi:MAG: PspC domain-containing protein [Chloroflexi bacterium]|nr:PspC domain-containing protein [Chloroflexota bacterium]